MLEEINGGSEFTSADTLTADTFNIILSELNDMHNK